MVYSNKSMMWVNNGLENTLALSKELLGIVRSKYGTIPIPGSEVSLDGDTLELKQLPKKNN